MTTYNPNIPYNKPIPGLEDRQYIQEKLIKVQEEVCVTAPWFDVLNLTRDIPEPLDKIEYEIRSTRVHVPGQPDKIQVQCNNPRCK